MYISTYIRKRGKYYHLIFEMNKYGKKMVKSKSSKTENKEIAGMMLEEFTKECIDMLGLTINEKINKPEKLFKAISENCDIYATDIKICEFAKNYVMMRYKAVSDDTYASYLSILKNSLIPYFFKNNKKISEINAIDIQKYYYHELNVRNVSVNTVLHYHNLLSLIFKYACKLSIIDKNPLLIVEKPKKEKYTAKTYTSEEIKKLLHIMRSKDEYLYFGVLMAVQYGLRRSEIVGLKWRAINFEENTINIISTVTEAHINGERILICKDKTKSIAGMRSFILTSGIKEILLKMKEEQEKNKIIFGTSYYKKDEEYIYVNKIGERITPNYLTTGFCKFIKKYKLPHIRFHDLRHSAASLLYEANINVKDIQTFLGHSNAKTTMDIYVHLQNRANRNTVSAITEKIDI